MLYVNRNRFKKPEFMESTEWKAFVKEWIQFNLKGGTRKTQIRYPFEKMFYPFYEDTLKALSAVFGGRCAYTEQVSPKLAVDHFRPISDSIGLEDEVSAEH